MTASPARLSRETFATSRLLEFCSTKELINQTGHKVDEWPLVILKELVDNALDACEEAEVAPRIAVTVRGGHIAVAPGLAMGFGCFLGARVGAHSALRAGARTGLFRPGGGRVPDHRTHGLALRQRPAGGRGGKPKSLRTASWKWGSS